MLWLKKQLVRLSIMTTISLIGWEASKLDWKYWLASAEGQKIVSSLQKDTWEVRKAEGQTYLYHGAIRVMPGSFFCEVGKVGGERYEDITHGLNAAELAWVNWNALDYVSKYNRSVMIQGLAAPNALLPLTPGDKTLLNKRLDGHSDALAIMDNRLKKLGDEIAGVHHANIDTRGEVSKILKEMATFQKRDGAAVMPGGFGKMPKVEATYAAPYYATADYPKAPAPERPAPTVTKTELPK